MKKVMIFLILALTGIGAKAQWLQKQTGATSKITCFAIMGTIVFAGSSDGIFTSTDDGASWKDVSTDLGFEPIIALAVSGSKVYAAAESGIIFVSTNSGKNWTPTTADVPSFNVTSIAVSGSTIFVGTVGDGVYRSLNGGVNWDTTNTGFDMRATNCLMIKGTNIYAGNWDMTYVSSDNGSHWKGICNAFTRSLIDQDTMIFIGGKTDGIHRSGIKSNSFATANTGLTDLDVLGLASSNDDLLAATWNGVFFSSNQGSQWSNWTDNISNKHITAVAIRSHDLLLAGTSDGSVWVTFLLSGINKVSTTGIHIFPNPTKDLLSISSPNDISSVTLCDLQGRLLYNNNPATGSTNIDLSNFPKGFYFITVSTGNQVFTEKVIIE